MQYLIQIIALTALISATASAAEIIKVKGTKESPESLTFTTKNVDYVNDSADGKTDVYGKSGHVWTSRLSSMGSVIIREKVHIDTVTYAVTSGQLTLERGSELTTKGICTYTTKESVVEGTITLGSGYTAGKIISTWAADYYIFSVGRTSDENAIMTFKGSASLTQTGVNDVYNASASAKNRIYGTLNVGTADSTLTGSLRFDDFVFFTGQNTVLNLYSSNKIISGAAAATNNDNVAAGYDKNATSQADSVFFAREKGAVALTMNAYVDNEFGTIDAYTGSTITLNTSALDGSEGKQSLIINNLLVSADTAEEALSLNLLLNLAAGESLQIKNFNELLENDDLALNVKIFNADSSTYEDAVLGKDYAVSSTGWISAIPEPAEWAMIFGAIALAFVAYRRRK